MRQRSRRLLVKWMTAAALGVPLVTFVGCSSDTTVNAAISIAGADPTPDAAATRDREVAAVYAAAKAHDVSEILGLAAQLPVPTPSPSPVSMPTAVPSGYVASPGAPALPATAPSAVATNSPTPIPRYDPAIALALYYAEPSVYADSFVASYPSDTDGIMRDFGTRFVAAHVDRRGAKFPIDSLASLAVGGNARALARLYEALPASRGGIFDAYSRAIASAAANDPNRAIGTLALVTAASRVDVLKNAQWCGDAAKRMQTATTTTDFEAALKSDLTDRVRNSCGAAHKGVKKSGRHAKRVARGKKKERL